MDECDSTLKCFDFVELIQFSTPNQKFEFRDSLVLFYMFGSVNVVNYGLQVI